MYLSATCYLCKNLQELKRLLLQGTHKKGGYWNNFCKHPPFWLLYCICGQCSWPFLLGILSWNHSGSRFFLSSTSPKTREKEALMCVKSWWLRCFTVLHAPYNKKKSVRSWTKVMVEACFLHVPPPLKAIKDTSECHVSSKLREVDIGILPFPPWLCWFLTASQPPFRGGGSNFFVCSTMKSRHITQFKQNFSSRNKSSSVSSTFQPILSVLPLQPALCRVHCNFYK